MKKKNWIIWVVVAVVIVVIGWFSFGHSSQTSSKTVTVGVVGQTSQDEAIWKEIAKVAKDKYGVTVKLKNFSDYNQPNKALQNGDVDLNAFQHQAFLDAWNKANKGTLVSIGKTFITPSHLYSKKVTDVKDLPDGATIAVPNDASNESRALFLLKNAGLITLKTSAGSLATVKDIQDNPKNLKIKEVAAEQTARTLDDVDAAVVNTNYAVAAKLPDSEIIYTEPVNKDSEQWINLIAAKKSDANKEAYKDVVKAYHTSQVKKVIQKEYGNKEIPAWDLKLK
ncbi:UNVERIFIED_CONTAM: MetQ/NlpA family ABC transporter substrate-binding protein [Limosilactobacillus fermentum]